jgi:hypothetical protein
MIIVQWSLDMCQLLLSVALASFPGCNCQISSDRRKTIGGLLHVSEEAPGLLSS